MSKRARGRKTLSQQGLLGQKGVNLVERIVLDMGSRWSPSGPNEVGIDGYIELFDASNAEALGRTLAVQSKAVSKFSAETSDHFDFWCNQRDIDYWLYGNMPVVLVVSRPDSGEAFWIPVKEYFSNPERLATTKVRFSKRDDRFTPHSLSQLAALARPTTQGLYLSPLPRKERLFSNLLKLERFPQSIWIGCTECRRAGEVWAALRHKGADVAGSWILREKNLVSFHDLSAPAWTTVCDPGTVDSFGVDEWAASDDPDRCRQFVELLNQSLRSQVAPHVRYWPAEDCYAFSGRIQDGTKKRAYGSLKRRSSISVVSKFQSKSADGRLFEWLRHLAFRGQFRRFGGDWYLEITPTYRFTSDGLALERFHEDRLKGIKRLEGNRAVLSAVMFWADLLRPKKDLFDSGNLPLVFGRLETFETDVGLDDNAWGSHEHDATDRVDPAETQSMLLNFEQES